MFQTQQNDDKDDEESYIPFEDFTSRRSSISYMGNVETEYGFASKDEKKKSGLSIIEEDSKHGVDKS